MSNSFRLDIQYVGTGFSGWQRQPNRFTVQQALEQSYERFLSSPVTLVGSGRTDTGVHARHQVAYLRTNMSVPPKAILKGVLRYLPPGVAVFRAEEVSPQWRPRPATRREYRYFLWKTPDPPLFYRPFSSGTIYNLDRERMQEAIPALLGEHDFSSFRAAGCTSEHPVRRLEKIEIVDHPEFWEFRITGNAFLRRMVRILVGTLVEVGRSALEPEDMEPILEGRHRDLAGPTLPPEGLFLWKIDITEEDLSLKIPPTIWEIPRMSP